MSQRWGCLVLPLLLSCAGPSSSSRPAERAFVVGEAIVVIEAGAALPEQVLDKRCELVSWGSKTTALLRCSPIGDDPQETQALVEALEALPGVASASPNMIRRKVE